MSDLQSRIQAPPPRWAEADRERAVLITHIVAFATGVPAGDIASPGRQSPEAGTARALAMYLANTALAWTLSRVGAAFERDRTTVGHACRRMEDRRDDPVFDVRVAELEACLRAAPSCTGGLA